MLSPLVSQRLGLFVSKEKGEDLVVLKGLIEDGKVTPVIGATFPLSEVPQAMRHLEGGHGRGRSSSRSERARTEPERGLEPLTPSLPWRCSAD